MENVLLYKNNMSEDKMAYFINRQSVDTQLAFDLHTINVVVGILVDV